MPDGEPMRGGVAFADVFTGVYSALAVLAALNERHASRKGSYIDMALLDTQVAVLANQASSYLVSGKVPQRTGNGHPAVVPYQVFAVADGHVIIACGNDTQFERLSALIGAPELAADPRYKTNAGRVVNRETLIPRMVPLIAKMARTELLAKLEAAGVPGGPINTLEDVFADPQVLARKLRIELPSAFAKGGAIPGVRAPITINGVRMAADRAPPVLGQHTDEVLREIGEA